MNNLGCFPLDIRPQHLMSVCIQKIHTYSEFPWDRSSFGPPSPSECSTPCGSRNTLYLNRFRRKPAISEFDQPFTPREKSSPCFATHVSSVLQNVLPFFQPALREITRFRVKFIQHFESVEPKSLKRILVLRISHTFHVCVYQASTLRLKQRLYEFTR